MPHMAASHGRITWLRMARRLCTHTGQPMSGLVPQPEAWHSPSCGAMQMQPCSGAGRPHHAAALARLDSPSDGGSCFSYAVMGPTFAQHSSWARLVVVQAAHGRQRRQLLWQQSPPASNLHPRGCATAAMAAAGCQFAEPGCISNCAHRKAAASSSPACAAAHMTWPCSKKDTE